MSAFITIIKTGSHEVRQFLSDWLAVAAPLLCLHQPVSRPLRRMGRWIGVQQALPPAPDAALRAFDSHLSEEVLLNLDTIKPGHVQARIAAEDADGLWQGVHG